ncbi:MAG: TonB-dependent receptor domain-containing protein [Acidobacteriota bacterium]
MKAVTCLLVVIACVLGSAAVARAQGGSTSAITGIVQDSEGGVLPGATVIVTSNATGSKFEAVANETGTYAVPALSAGVYTVTVSLQGFKTAQINDVRVQLGIPTTLNATLGVGELSETITVSGASAELINTLTPAVTATLNVDQIALIPTPTRNALNAVTFLVGVNTAGTMRGSTINGLPESFLNLTLDGVSNNDTFNKNGDGFFSPVRPRQDAVEAVTVTTAAGGAEVGGHGGATINFVTRSGTNRFTGSAYDYYRDTSLNSNYWFNERNGQPRSAVRLNQYGARQGGPIIRGKAFFFVHFEEVRNPNAEPRTRTVLHPRALDGWFRYNVTVAGQQTVREVNVMDLARAGEQIATTDPLVMRILQAIQASPQQAGTISPASDPLLMSYFFLNPGDQNEKQPAIRIDYNLSDRHRLTGTYNHFFEARGQDHINGADRRFPSSPNYRQVRTTRPTRSVALRSTLSNNLVSELRGGVTRGERLFFGRGERNAPSASTFDDTSGLAIDLDLNIGLTNWHIANTLSSRSGYQYTLDETLNWQKGSHSVTLGGSAFLGRAWEDSQQLTPGIDLRFDTANDPAASLFTTANFPGASAAQLTDARDLYALLTGRVGAVTGLAALDAETNQYTYLGRRRRAGKLDVFSAYAQDSWRLTPTLTLNGGLRWDVQMPFAPSNDTMTTASLADICGVSGIGRGGIYTACNFYAPGAHGGKVPAFAQFTSGTRGYNTDWNNIAPNVGVAWRPNAQSGWLRRLLGDPEQATLRGGYSVAYERQGIGGFTGIYGPNPGSTLSLTRDANTGLVGPGETWPVLLREANRLYPASFPETPTFPIPIRPNRADNINAFHPDIEVASARSWTIGLQRSLSKDMAVEIRYVGTRGVNQWSTLNYNERNIIENGFIDEFRLAMANLRANNAAGGSRSGSFAYFGTGTGTTPLPIYLSYLNGRSDAGNPAAYTGGAATWSNATYAGRLVQTNPNPNGAASDLDGTLTFRDNAMRAGQPANFFVVNPNANNVNVRDSGAFSSYHALQIEVRRRLSRGLSLNGSYQYALEEGSAFLGFHFGRVSDPSNASVRHAIKAQWDWTLPVGPNERYGRNLHGVLNALVGGWQFNGAGRVQQRTANFGNVRLVGMTKAEAQKLYRFEVRPDPQTGLPTVFTMPDDVILNTRRAFSVSATSSTGYSALGVPEGRYFAPANSADCIQLKSGDCAPRTTMLLSPWFTRFDIGLTKKIPVGGNRSIEIRADILNVFDNVNFTVTDTSRTPGSGAGIFQTDAAYRDLNNTYDPGGRLGQLAIRFNW